MKGPIKLECHSLLVWEKTCREKHSSLSGKVVSCEEPKMMWLQPLKSFMSLLPGDHVVDLAAVPEAAEGPFQLRLSDLRQTPV